MNKKMLTILILINLILSIYSLTAQPSTEIDSLEEWTRFTHSNSTEPQYDTVFTQEEVIEIDIVIDTENWTAMQTDLSNNLGEKSNGLGLEGNDIDGERPPRPEGDDIDGERPPRPEGDDIDGERPPRPEGDDLQGERPEGKQTPNAVTTDFDPIWVESSVVFNDTIWEHVGIRYKGNSSLSSAYGSGHNKLSFKLGFDKFEDEYSSIDNQRFYGFKQLNLNNNFSDQTLLREKVSADLFRDFGLVSAKTTFCALYIDYGEGRQYFGLYTLVEEMDDTVIETQLGDDSGNLYKPDGEAASFANGTYDQDILSKKSNEDENDYSDVLNLYQTINSRDRLDNYDVWKSSLENILNVNGFIKWLAANTVIQNWDTYGNSTRNYYLYNFPGTGKLNWIPWDNNESLQSGKGANYDLDYSQIGGNWPLIKYILDDDEYKAIYKDYLQLFIKEVFSVDKMQTLYTGYYELIKDYVYAEEAGYSFLRSDDSFDKSIDVLKQHVITRNEAVIAYLNN